MEEITNGERKEYKVIHLPSSETTITMKNSITQEGWERLHPPVGMGLYNNARTSLINFKE